MGISMLNGIVADLLGGLLGVVQEALVKAVGAIIGKVMELVMYCIHYICAAYLYQIARFLLGLIDFVEMMFRSLAGLENSSMKLSLNGKSGDLLIQILTSKEIVDVFLAMCIVGLFLLIVTTIFQMIKVEYTTEGANNSKTSIVSKSLKSLSNLLLIPALVVFGVFIGNQVLDLLDTATSGVNNSKISGCLFVTAASNCMYKDTDGAWSEISGVIGSVGSLAGGSIALNVVGVTFAVARTFGGEKFEKLLYGDDDNPNPRKNEIENKFMTGEYSYSNPLQVFSYYNIFDINYLVLIFGACIIIKCLYHVCFAMVDRLYQCVALFVISPVVIGMSPVKDSLGSWRGKFIGKALQAYGTVIGINLFFIIVRVLLDVKVDFGSGVLNYFGSGFMEGLLKMIFVIAGCIMIEKFAKEMGTYFGADDGLSTGKELADKTTDGIKKATSVAVGVGTMAVTGGAMAPKLIQGMANKVKAGKQFFDERRERSGLAENLDSHHRRLDEQNADLNKYMKDKNISSADLDEYESLLSNKGANEKSLRDVRKKIQESEAIKNDTSGTYTYLEKKQAEKALEKYNSEKQTLEFKQNKLQQMENNGYSAVYQKKQDIQQTQSLIDKAEPRLNELNEKAMDRKLHRAESAGLVKETMKQMGGDTLQSYIPKSFTEMKKQYSDAQKKLGEKSPEFQAIIEARAKAKSDKEKDSIEGRNKDMIGARNARQAAIITKAIVEKLDIVQLQQNAGLDKLNNSLNDATRRMNDPNASQAQKDLAVQEVSRIQNAILQMNKDVKFNADGTINGDFHLKLDTGDFKKSIDELIKKNAKSQDFDKAIEEQLKKWGETGNVTIMKELQKIVEEIKNMAK